MVSYLPITRSPSQTCHANPKLKSTGAGRYQLLSCWWDAYRKKLGLKDFPKSQVTLALQQMKERGALLMIDRGDIRRGQSTVAATSGLHCRALVMVSSEYKADSLIAKFKEAGAEYWERLMAEQSLPRLSPLWLSASSKPLRHGAANHYRDNAITTKPSDKNARELKLANAAITDMARRRDAAAPDAKYIKELAELKLKMMLCVMMLLVVVGCTSKRWACQSASKLPALPPAWIMQPPLTGDTALIGIISPSERG